VAAGGGAGAASGEEAGEVTGDVPLTGLAAVFPKHLFQRPFRPSPADAFCPSFVRERIGLRTGKSPFAPSRQRHTPHSRAAGVLWPVPAGLKSVHLITSRTGMSPSLVCKVSSDRK